MENAKTKADRREAIYQAIEALSTEIEQRLEAMRALELVYFGRQITGELELIPKPAEKAKKGPRGSTPPKKTGPGKGKGRKKLSQTKAAKLAREYREKKKREAAAAAPAAAKKPPARSEPVTARATGAHEALQAKSEAEVEREASGPGRPGNGLVDRKQPKNLDTPPASSANHSNPGRKPTLPPVKSGTLTGMTQCDAIRAVLTGAARQLRSDEILARLQVGGYHFKSANPRQALSVTLSTMRSELKTETRAGRVLYDPIPNPERGED